MTSSTSSGVVFRLAEAGDLSRIVELLADDPLGRARETLERPLPDSYRLAFEAIRGDANSELIVGVFEDAVVGVLQITFIPGLTHRGSWRASIEGVRVAAEVRARGIGRAMIEWAIARAGERRCRIVQLTTDKGRPDALRFYEGLGFRATHEGLKLHLSGNDPVV
jgi:ribosomal protein S18 acetylase RimI-like enzyme